MTWITKCSNTKCESKETCYRFTAPDSRYQSYTILDGSSKDDCEYFIEDERE